MPKSTKPSAPSDSAATAGAIADALCRSASECCRQHDRVARIVERSEVDAELKFAQQFCELCHATLRDLVAEYEKVSVDAESKSGEAWWHRANSLWHASREYLRRHSGCDHLTSKAQRHDSAHLGALAMEYELEASALLALRHATDAYRKERPDVA